MTLCQKTSPDYRGKRDVLTRITLCYEQGASALLCYPFHRLVFGAVAVYFYETLVNRYQDT